MKLTKEGRVLRIIQLLEQKNHYLEKFYTLNESEILNFAQANFDGLEVFYQNRERILDMMSYIDREIDKCEIGPDMVISMEDRDVVRECLAEKEGYVTRILAQDLEILSAIEKAKSAIIRELQEVRRSRKAVGGYKSGPAPSRLNEEA